MLVRPYEHGDLQELQNIHAKQGFSYAFPDLRNPLFMTKLVLLGDRAGREAPTEVPTEVPEPSRGSEPSGVLGAALLRLTAEAYLLLDPTVGSPRQRWEWLLALHAATEQEAARRGLEDVHAWLPPEISATFGKRLARMGWLRDDAWTPYCKRLG